MIRYRPWLLACLLLAGLGCPSSDGDAAGDPETKAALEHWRSLPPERQQELAQRYDEVRELPVDQRAQLQSKKRVLDDELERVEAELGDADRARLSALIPHERREVLRELVLAHKRQRGLERRADLPPHVLHKLRHAPPHERERQLHELRDRARREGPNLPLRKLGEKLGKSADEIEQALRAPLPERMQTLQAWRRALPPREGERVGERGAERVGERGGQPPPRRGPEAGNGPPGAGGPPLRPSLDDLIEFRSLEPAARRAAIDGRVRERVLDWLTQRGALDPARREELAGLERDEFDERLHEILRAMRKPR
ncbi:MAG: hypothetical protein FJ299_04085 [Planctomycetes bacterium]|nr:hypothetical protein [Planctomycetota bacterium]